jgi:hypothetical protein
MLDLVYSNTNSVNATAIGGQSLYRDLETLPRSRHMVKSQMSQGHEALENAQDDSKICKKC